MPLSPLPTHSMCASSHEVRSMTIINPGKNHIKIELCSQNYNVDTCAGTAPTDRHPYTSCKEWVPPGQSVQLLFDMNVTYLVFEYCIDNPQSIHCLTSPIALEVLAAVCMLCLLCLLVAVQRPHSNIVVCMANTALRSKP